MPKLEGSIDIASTVESSDSPEPPPNPVLPPATDFQLARPNRLNTRATHVKVASKSNSIATSPHIMRPTTENLSSGVDRQGNKIYSTLPAQTNKPVRSDTLILEHSGVPPINVLLVEDNMINLRLLEAFMKRLKVRYKTAIDGEQAISRWKEGGFHLVLMDIQLPKINGLEATRMIRNLETESGIGLGASLRALSNSETEGLRDMESLEGQTGDGNGEIKIMTAASDAGDSTASLGQTMKQVGTTNFKSPVIIVALTASSLESDRHDALAAGCNDFLTKVCSEYAGSNHRSFLMLTEVDELSQPVNYMYLERKVMEWGCMQALIDFDGWRQWKIDAAIAEEAMIKENKARQEARAIARASKLNGGGGSSNAYLSGSGSRPSMRRRELGNREGGLARGKSRDVSAVGKKFGDKSGPDSQTEDSGQTTEAPFKPPITSSDSNDSTTGFIASVVESEPEQYPQRQPDLQDEVPNQEPQTRSQGKHKRPPSLNLYPGGSAASGTSIHGSQRLSQTLHVRHDLASPLGRTLSNNEGPGEGSGAEDEETPLGSTRATVDGKLKRSSESGAEVVADGEMLPLGLLNGGVDVRGKRWKGEREGPELG